MLHSHNHQTIQTTIVHEVVVFLNSHVIRSILRFWMRAEKGNDHFVEIIREIWDHTRPIIENFSTAIGVVV